MIRPQFMQKMTLKSVFLGDTVSFFLDCFGKCIVSAGFNTITPIGSPTFLTCGFNTRLCFSKKAFKISKMNNK